MNKKTIITAAILLTIAIILGAFGAHGLKKIASIEKVASFETGVRYQFYTAFSLFILGLNSSKFEFKLKLITNLLLIGTILFTGSIYLLSLQEFLGTNLSFLGPVTPLGGLLMIISWVIFIFKFIKQQ